MGIFDTELTNSRLLLKEYSKRINTARVLLFVFLGLIFSIYTIKLLAAIIKQDAGLMNEQAVGLASAVLLLGIVRYSYKRPFSCLTVLASLLCIGVAFFLFLMTMVVTYEISSGNGSHPDKMALILLALIFQVAMVYFVTRGTAAAHKYEKLQKLIENQTGAV